MTRVQGQAAVLPRYFLLKRAVDFVLALSAILLLAPVFILTTLLILLDVGSPVLFWQQRVGQGFPKLLAV